VKKLNTLFLLAVVLVLAIDFLLIILLFKSAAVFWFMLIMLAEMVILEVCERVWPLAVSTLEFGLLFSSSSSRIEFDKLRSSSDLERILADDDELDEA
jgi:hypothetical protein